MHRRRLGLGGRQLARASSGTGTWLARSGSTRTSGSARAATEARRRRADGCSRSSTSTRRSSPAGTHRCATLLDRPRRSPWPPGCCCAATATIWRRPASRSPRTWRPTAGSRARRAARRSSAPFEVGAASGALMMVRRDDFLALGGFWETLFMYGEEADYCLRARGRVMLDPRSAIRHAHGHAAGPALSDIRLYWPSRNRLLNAARHLPGPAMVRSVLASAAFDLLTLARVRRPSAVRSVLRGWRARPAGHARPARHPIARRAARSGATDGEPASGRARARQARATLSPAAFATRKRRYSPTILSPAGRSRRNAR